MKLYPKSSLLSGCVFTVNMLHCVSGFPLSLPMQCSMSPSGWITSEELLLRGCRSATELHRKLPEPPYGRDALLYTSDDGVLEMHVSLTSVFQLLPIHLLERMSHVRMM